jgi:hypothetical protein
MKAQITDEVLVRGRRSSGTLRSIFCYLPTFRDNLLEPSSEIKQS